MTEEKKADKPENPLRKKGAKLYLVEQSLLVKVSQVGENEIKLQGGTKEYPREMNFGLFEFDSKCERQEIVAQSQAEFNDNGEFVGIKGQEKPKRKTQPPKNKKPEQPKKQENPSDLEVGWINEKTGKFSREKKRGYSKIEFRRVKKKVELELDEQQLEKLKELGVL